MDRLLGNSFGLLFRFETRLTWVGVFLALGLSQAQAAGVAVVDISKALAASGLVAGIEAQMAAARASEIAEYKRLEQRGEALRNAVQLADSRAKESVSSASLSGSESSVNAVTVAREELLRHEEEFAAFLAKSAEGPGMDSALNSELRAFALACLEEYSKKAGYDVVIEKVAGASVLYVSSSSDITMALAKYMENKGFSRRTLGVPTATK